MFNEEINNILEEIEKLEDEINTKLYNFLVTRNQIKFEDIEILIAKKEFLNIQATKLIEKDYKIYVNISIE